MSYFALPAEGVTLEYLAKPLTAIFLQPILTAGLLLASYQRSRNVNHILSVLSKDRVSPGLFKTAMKILVAAGVLYRLNNTLTKFVLNNFVSDKSWDWRREIVLVTGGCGGIGELIVRKLSEKNIKVVIFDVVEPQSRLPANTTFYKVDITSSEAIHETAEKMRREVGDPSVLVNNAGIGTYRPILEETEQQIRRTFDVNVVAHFLLVREFAPHMIKQNHGHIVTIASLTSFAASASNVDYCCSKAAALSFHEGLAQELKSRYNANKVRTTVVHPTWVRTPLIEAVSRGKNFKEFVLEPVTVANAVVSQILKAESAQLIIPGRYSFVPSVRGWPSWLQEGIRNSFANLLKDAP